MTEPYSPIPAGLVRHLSTGRVPIAGLASGLGVGTATALVLATLYAYACIYIPIVQVSVLLSCGFGAAIGGSAAAVMRSFKVRNRWVTVGLAVLLSAFGWFVSWFPWVYAIFAQAGEVIGLFELLNPFFMFAALSSIYETGTWSIGSHSGSAVSGAFLGIVWFSELVTIVGVGGFTALALTKDKVFCEACDNWCTVLPSVRPFDFSAGSALKEVFTSQGDLRVLTNQPVPALVDKWLVLKVGFCEKCGQTNVAALDQVTLSVDRRGRATQAVSAFVPFYLVSRSDMELLRGQR